MAMLRLYSPAFDRASPRMTNVCTGEPGPTRGWLEEEAKEVVAGASISSPCAKISAER